METPAFKHQLIVPDEHLDTLIFFHTGATPDFIAPHWHQAIEINYMLRWPKSKIFVDGQTFYAETGRVWLANSQAPHYEQPLSTDTKRQAVSIIYPYAFVHSLFPEVDTGRFELNDLSKLSSLQLAIYREQLIPVMTALGKAYQAKNDPTRTIRLRIGALQVLQLLIASFFVTIPVQPTSNMDAVTAERIQTATQYVESHYQQDLKIDDLAKKLHLSTGYLARFLKANLGMTAGELINFTRVKHARTALNQREGTQSQIAVNCGFSGLRTMNRQLEKYFNTSAKALFQSGKGH